MSCCGGGVSSAAPCMPTSINSSAVEEIMRQCPNECCNLFKLMMDPCAQMLDRNVRRNVYGMLDSPYCCTWCPPMYSPPADRYLIRCRTMRPIPERCPPITECDEIDTSTFVPIPESKALTKPRNNDSWKILCCTRPKWDKTGPPRLSWIPHYNFKPLAPLSTKYKKWISCVDSRTDHNLLASRFSSRNENSELIRKIPAPCQEQCPCHCCC